MSRCPECGMKECCGADMAPEIETHEATIADLHERLAKIVALVTELNQVAHSRGGHDAMMTLDALVALCDAELAKEGK